MATKRRSSKVIWIRSGWLRGSIYWVLLFRGRIFATKPLSQKHRSTFLPLQDANPTPSFGGFGLTPVTRILHPELAGQLIGELSRIVDRQLAFVVLTDVGRWPAADHAPPFNEGHASQSIVLLADPDKNPVGYESPV